MATMTITTIRDVITSELKNEKAINKNIKMTDQEINNMVEGMVILICKKCTLAHDRD